MAGGKTGGEKELTVGRLPKSYESLSLVLELLADDAFFGREPLGRIMKVVKSQVGAGTHVAALRGSRLLGYGGYIYVSPENGDAWMTGHANLKPLEPGAVAGLPAEGRAAALTVVAARETAVVVPLIRHLRESHRGYRIFFKREFLPGCRVERKGTVKAV